MDRRLYDTLAGVVVGGLIGSVTPIATLIATHVRWKREMRLQHLKEERTRLEALFASVLERFKVALIDNGYPYELTFDIVTRMPLDIKNIYTGFIKGEKGKPEDEDVKEPASADMSLAMRQALGRLDHEIDQLLGYRERGSLCRRARDYLARLFARVRSGGSVPPDPRRSPDLRMPRRPGRA